MNANVNRAIFISSNHAGILPVFWANCELFVALMVKLPPVILKTAGEKSIHLGVLPTGVVITSHCRCRLDCYKKLHNRLTGITLSARLVINSLLKK